MVRTFQHGELRLSTVVIVAVFIIGGLTVAGISLDIGDRLRSRVLEVSLVVVCAALAMTAATRLHASWDLSEDRRNSFSRADEAALRAIHVPLHLKIFLAAEDPRLTDLRERGASEARTNDAGRDGRVCREESDGTRCTGQ